MSQSPVHSETVKIAAGILGPIADRNYDLGPLTTFRIGGPASLFVKVRSARDLEVVRQAVVASGIDVLVIGNGSNLLVSDSGFEGLALTLSARYSAVEVDHGVVRCGGAASLPVVARQSVGSGLTGFEWAVGVPGSVGGAVRMNAGGHGSQLAQTLFSVGICDVASKEPDPAFGDRQRAAAPTPRKGILGRTTAERSRGQAHVRAAAREEVEQQLWSDGQPRDVSTLGLGYRSSNLAPTEVVIWAEIHLERGRTADSEARLSEIVRWRREHQPGGQNCGSVFINPPDDSAGRLIEEAGLKGFRIGSACVSEKHANFFQADPGGSAQDMKALIDHVASVVVEKSGVMLSSEVKMTGF